MLWILYFFYCMEGKCAITLFIFTSLLFECQCKHCSFTKVVSLTPWLYWLKGHNSYTRSYLIKVVPLTPWLYCLKGHNSYTRSYLIKVVSLTPWLYCLKGPVSYARSYLIKVASLVLPTRLQIIHKVIQSYNNVQGHISSHTSRSHLLRLSQLVSSYKFVCFIQGDLLTCYCILGG